MKKINWGFIAMFMLIALLTWTGIYFIENEWRYEIESAIIWVSGMVCFTSVYLVNEVKKLIEKIMK